MKIKKICFDIDGIICTTKKKNYNFSKPIIKNIKFINKLYEQKYEIILHTARFMGRNKNVIKKAEKQAKKITLQQLKIWGVNYHKIFFGKPSFDIVIDDKNLQFNKNWIKLLKTKLKNN
jgi:hydroxymethylpyrimidine pyrophosphatase-like HAD family hydrolase